MKSLAVRAALGTFLAGAVLSVWLGEKPFVFLDAEPAPFVIAPAGSFKTSVSFDPGRPLKDLVVAFELETDAGGRVELHANGRCVTHVRIGPKERCTARIPRLFLRAGANELEVRNPADVKLALKPLDFPSHRASAGKPPAAPPLPPSPEIWGEPEYRWEKGEVALWVAVQGEGKQLLEDATVTSHLRGEAAQMKRVGRGTSGMASEAPVRYEAVWPLASLRPGANPVEVRVDAKGHASARAWFPLRKTFPSEARRRVASSEGVSVRVPFRLHPEAPPREFAFRLFMAYPVESELAPGEEPLDYDQLTDWIASIRSRGGAVFLDRQGQDLRTRFDDFVYLLEADGIVVRDEKGWDPAVEPGGFWDKMLHQRQRVGILGTPGSLLEAPEDSVAGRLEAHRRGSRVVAWGSSLEVDLAGAGPGETASLEFGEKAELRIKAPSSARLELVSDVGGTPAVVASWSGAAASYPFQVASPAYFRAIATDEKGGRAVSAPVWLEVRPPVRDRVVHRVNESWVLRGGEKRSVSFTPAAGSFHVLEIGVDPGETFAGAEERVEVSLDGRPIGLYRAANTIHGHDGKAPIRHVVPFRVSLGRLEKGKAVTVDLSSPAPDDGIAVSYAYVLRTATPALALVDLHSHSRITENFSSELHRTMGYDLIMTAHGGFPNPDARKRALERARELTDGQMKILIGGERGDHFGACHISLGFVTQDLDRWNARDQKYSSAIALGLDWDGVACLNHPSEDSRLGWQRKHYQWGYADPHYHGFAGWAHKEHHYGAGDHYWRLVTIVEYFNGYGAPSIAAGKNEGGYGPRMRWHEEIGRYVRGERRAPLFAVGNSDTKTFQQETERLRIGSMYAGTMVHAAAADPAAIGASLISGNSVAACHADTRLLVTAEDAEGRLYHPGNRIVGTGPFKVSVEGWAPRDLALVRLVGPRGTIVERALRGRHVLEEFTLESLGPWDWFLVELRGDGPRTGAVSNPFLR